jgi:ABC-type transport system involved in Fe-S cluster assembly fused permease/ATPase subunit
VQVDRIGPKLKPPRTKRLKLKCDIVLSTSAFKFNLRRYNEVEKAARAAQFSRFIEQNCAQGYQTMAGQCRLTLSNPL